jgi:hypothetical protein
MTAPGAQRERVERAPFPAAGAAWSGASTAVFHAPQDPQRPNQRDCSLPQAEQ